MTVSNQNFEEAVALAASANMKDRQGPLMALYKHDSEQGKIVDFARTTSAQVPASTPLYTEVIAGRDNSEGYAIGVHKAVGGIGDFPVPGDILCAAIASCLDSTIRIIASRLSIPLKRLDVSVKASVDVRGTLRVDDTVPVGFQGIEIEVDLQPMVQLPEATLRAILNAAEHSCVVIQTLRNPPEISVTASSRTRNRSAA